MCSLRIAHRLVVVMLVAVCVGYGVGLARAWLGQPSGGGNGDSVSGSATPPASAPSGSELGMGDGGMPRGHATQTDVATDSISHEAVSRSPAAPRTVPLPPEEAQVDSEHGDGDRETFFTPLQNEKLHEVVALSAKFGFSQSDVIRSVEGARAGRPFDTGRNYSSTEGVIRLWGEGKWEDALAIGENRLRMHQNDLAGLIIRAGYARETGDMDVYLDTGKRMLEVLSGLNTPSVSAIKAALVSDLTLSLTRLQRQDPGVLQACKDPARRPPDYPFIYEFFLKACESDGLF